MMSFCLQNRSFLGRTFRIIKQSKNVSVAFAIVLTKYQKNLEGRDCFGLQLEGTVQCSREVCSKHVQ